MRRYLYLVLLASALFVGCEGSRNNSSWSHREEGTDVVPALKKAGAVDSTAAQADSAATQGKH
jgi:hypothetical protein